MKNKQKKKRIKNEDTRVVVFKIGKSKAKEKGEEARLNL